MKPSYRKAVFIVVYRKQEKAIDYLLLKRHKHWKGWEFPKGGIDAAESPAETAKREVKEESGLKPIKIKKYNSKGIYQYDRPLPDRPDMKGQTFILFSAEIKGDKVKIDKREHSAYAWLDFKKALKKLTWNNQKKCLRIVNKFLSKRSA